jgi:multiple sugar transport system ATP-binding protein
MRAAVPARVEVKVEEAVRFSWNPDKVMLFDARTGLNLRHQAA